MSLHPFPQGTWDEEGRRDIYEKYRKDMISGTGIAIFLFGNKRDLFDSSRYIEAQGCWDEFEMARENKNIIIPVGSTGFMARKIFNEVKTHIDDYKYLEKYIDILEKGNDVEKLIKTVITIAEEQHGI